jgi:hypothetical protein
MIEREHKVFNDILRSFKLENYHENIEEQEDKSIGFSFNQMVARE